jgi:Cof subfamily protein (haloacid dehalogenase superfamily)
VRTGDDDRSVRTVIRLVATDLDGTLFRSDGTVGDRTVRALSRAEAAGLVVVFVTARPMRWVDELARLVSDHGIVICSNGAIVYDVGRRRVIEVEPLPAETARAIVSAVRGRVAGVAFARESLDGFAKEAGYVERDAVPTGSSIGPIERLLDDTVVKLLVRHERMEPHELRRLVAGAVDGTATVTASTDGALVEISAPGVTKATTLARFCAGHGIAPEEVVAVGDMLNDLPMLAWAGTAVAVANAHPDVLALADATVPSNDEDGVAALLDGLLSDR